MATRANVRGVVADAQDRGREAVQAVGEVKDNMSRAIDKSLKERPYTLQDLYGQAREAAVNTAQAVRESAEGADDFVRTTIEQRPYTAAAIALGVGFLIGRFAHRHNY
jgi:ElaB/YqjD/DUF883 family membrane-anchored ribosome-binding protein